MTKAALSLGPMGYFYYCYYYYYYVSGLLGRALRPGDPCYYY